MVASALAARHGQGEDSQHVAAIPKTVEAAIALGALGLATMAKGAKDAANAVGDYIKEKGNGSPAASPSSGDKPAGSTTPDAAGQKPPTGPDTAPASPKGSNNPKTAQVAGGAAKAAGEGATLYRAVGAKELADIEAAGFRYRVPAGGVEGKYFFRTPEQASNFARMMGDQPYTTTSVGVSPAELGRATPINPAGEGPGYFFLTPDVPTGPVSIWNYSVVP